jgi:hypothetical protein
VADLHDVSLLEAMRYQRAAVALRSLASPLYGSLLDTMIADYEANGICAEVFDAGPQGLDPIPDAVVLRFLGALHRLVLEGRLPELAAWFPTAGGAFDPDGPDPGPTFLAAVADNRAELVEGLGRGVQTNEVGRCATLAVGFTAVLRRWRLPLRLLEVGASAGLNLRWDRWRYEADGSWGDSDAHICFGEDAYRAPKPDVSAPLGPDEAVAARHGCDRSPIDPATEDGRLTLRSYVWPDQADRHRRLDAALDAARELPADVAAEDAGSWVTDRVAEPVEGVATVVYHSIVWQYLPRATRDSTRSAILGAGERASAKAPLAWVRMEPGTNPAEAAELRVRWWPGGQETLLAHSGYHGRPVWRA